MTIHHVRPTISNTAKDNLPKLTNRMKRLIASSLIVVTIGTTALSLTFRNGHAPADVNQTATHAQLIRDSSLGDTNNGPSRWHVTDSTLANVRIDATSGYDDANPVALVWEAKRGAQLVNDAFSGFPISPNERYRCTLIIKGSGSVNVSLQSTDGDVVFASKTVKSTGDKWQKMSFTLGIHSGVRPIKDARLYITATQDGVYQLSKVMLTNDAYNYRNDGMRRDLRLLICEMKPRTIRSQS